MAFSSLRCRLFWFGPVWFGLLGSIMVFLVLLLCAFTGASLLLSGKDYDAYPTEGGHAEMAPRNDLEYEFIKVNRPPDSSICDASVPFIGRSVCRSAGRSLPAIGRG